MSFASYGILELIISSWSLANQRGVLNAGRKEIISYLYNNSHP